MKTLLKIVLSSNDTDASFGGGRLAVSCCNILQFEDCFPRPPFKKKHLAETLTIGFLAGIAATIGMFRLIKK
jgi:hypothetical protein